MQTGSEDLNQGRSLGVSLGSNSAFYLSILSFPSHLKPHFEQCKIDRTVKSRKSRILLDIFQQNSPEYIDPLILL